MKCLIYDEMHPSLVPELLALGMDVDYRPELKDRFELLGLLGDYEGIIGRTKFKIDAEVIEAGTKLKFIARAGAGLEDVNEELAKGKGIEIISAPEGNRDAVGDHTLAMLLALLNNIVPAHQQVVQGLWLREQNRGYELGDKTVGIIGLGNMGTAFAKRLQGFGCRVLAYDKYKTITEPDFVRQVGLETIFAEADILSIHTPLTPETKNWLNYDFFSSFAKPVIILNTARGKVLVLKDLLRAFEEGKVVGACLDVLENEQPASRTIEEISIIEALSTKRVILSPHVAGWTFESYRRINDVLVKKITGKFFPSK